jgi:hypothetical protein
MKDEHDEHDPQETNMGQDPSFALTMAELEGWISRRHTHRRLAPDVGLLVHDFNFSGFSIADISVGTDSPSSGKHSTSVVRLDLQTGWFTVDIDGSEVTDVDDNPCILTIRARGSDEALTLARLLELAGVALRRQIEENSRSKP